jgi:hypothetical protein
VSSDPYAGMFDIRPDSDPVIVNPYPDDPPREGTPAAWLSRFDCNRSVA